MDLKKLIKCQSLALREHKNTKGRARNGEWQARLLRLRGDARDTLLAYAFLRGRAYKTVEPNAKVAPAFFSIAMLVLGWDPEDHCHLGGRNRNPVFDDQVETLRAWVEGHDRRLTKETLACASTS